MNKIGRTTCQIFIVSVVLLAVMILPAFAGIDQWTSTGDAAVCSFASIVDDLVCAEWTYSSTMSGLDPATGYTMTCCIQRSDLGRNNLGACEVLIDDQPAIAPPREDDLDERG